MAYQRFKLFWGAVDIVESDEAAYTAAQIKGLGENATPPGIGVRRAQLVYDRSAIGTGEDKVVTHFDFQNFTGGNPDDSWTDADFQTVEGHLNTWSGAMVNLMSTKYVLDQIRWYRIGPGIAPPNPPARITEKNTVGTAAASMPPQVCATVTYKTAVRRAWGRSYLPVVSGTAYDGDGRIVTAVVDQICTTTHTMLSSCSAADFLPVVYSPRRRKVFTIEAVQVDNQFDVMRSRRYDKPTYRKVLQ